MNIFATVKSERVIEVELDREAWESMNYISQRNGSQRSIEFEFRWLVRDAIERRMQKYRNNCKRRAPFREKIMELISDEGPMKPKQIFKALNDGYHTYRTVFKSIAAGVEAGDLKYDSEGNLDIGERADVESEKIPDFSYRGEHLAFASNERSEKNKAAVLDWIKIGVMYPVEIAAAAGLALRTVQRHINIMMREETITAKQIDLRTCYFTTDEKGKVSMSDLAERSRERANQNREAIKKAIGNNSLTTSEIAALVNLSIRSVQRHVNTMTRANDVIAESNNGTVYYRMSENLERLIDQTNLY